MYVYIKIVITNNAMTSPTNTNAITNTTTNITTSPVITNKHIHNICIFKQIDYLLIEYQNSTQILDLKLLLTKVILYFDCINNIIKKNNEKMHMCNNEWLFINENDLWTSRIYPRPDTYRYILYQKRLIVLKKAILQKTEAFFQIKKLKLAEYSNITNLSF
jgi:hypothetical protein